MLKERYCSTTMPALAILSVVMEHPIVRGILDGRFFEPAAFIRGYCGIKYGIAAILSILRIGH